MDDCEERDEVRPEHAITYMTHAYFTGLLSTVFREGAILHWTFLSPQKCSRDSGSCPFLLPSETFRACTQEIQF